MRRHSCNLLFVEPCPLDYARCCYGLSTAFANVRCARAVDHEGAQRTAREMASKPSLVITDPFNEESEGLELIRQLHFEPLLFRAPVVVFTAAESGWDPRACQLAGAAASYRKPDDPSEFAASIRTIVRRWTSRWRCELKPFDVFAGHLPLAAHHSLVEERMRFEREPSYVARDLVTAE